MPDAPPAPTPSLRSSVVSAVDLVVRARWLILLVMTLGVSWLGLSQPNCDSDVLLFTRWAKPLVSGHWGKVYANLANQGGPLELLWNWLVTGGSQTCPRLSVTLPLGLLGAVLLVGVAVSVTRLVMRGERAVVVARVELAAGLVAAMTSSPWTLKWGHPADVAIPLLWVASASLARKGRWVAAGALLGVAAGFETWAVLGVAVLLAGGAARSVKSAAVAAAVGAGWYVPFVLTGSFGMFDMVWDVWPSSLLGLVTGASMETWGMRCVQTVAVLAAGVAVVLLTRSSRHCGWLAAATVGGVRILTDPMLWPYYWVIVTVPALVGVAALSCRGVPRRQRVAGFLSLAVLVAPHPPAPWAYLQLGSGLIGVLVTVHQMRRTTSGEVRPDAVA